MLIKWLRFINIVDICLIHRYWLNCYILYCYPLAFLSFSVSSYLITDTFCDLFTEVISKICNIEFLCILARLSSMLRIKAKPRIFLIWSKKRSEFNFFGCLSISMIIRQVVIVAHGSVHKNFTGIFLILKIEKICL